MSFQINNFYFQHFSFIETVDWTPKNSTTTQKCVYVTKKFSVSIWLLLITKNFIIILRNGVEPTATPSSAPRCERRSPVGFLWPKRRRSSQKSGGTRHKQSGKNKGRVLVKTILMFFYNFLTTLFSTAYSLISIWLSEYLSKIIFVTIKFKHTYLLQNGLYLQQKYILKVYTRDATKKWNEGWLAHIRLS